MRTLSLLCWMAVVIISPSFALEIPTKEGKIANLPNVATVEGDDSVKPRTDGTEEPTKEMVAEYEKVLNKFLKNKDKYDTQTLYVIPTVVHIVLPSAGSTANEAQGVEQEQIDVLNQAFADNNSPFFFDLQQILTHVNNGWWNDDSSMKPSTRVGDMGTLNIWYNNNYYLGYATFPVGYYNPSDGVVCSHSSVLGGSTNNYNLGATLVHEVGHWLALYHTFQGGCGANGDLISDTPPEQSSAYGCPIGRDTCSGCGPDPIHNYMDYSYDACMYEFTPLQNDRMTANYLQYRFFGTPPPCSGNDYLTNLGWSPPYPLGCCDGDCDQDSHCGPGLECFHRNNNEEVPGCLGDGTFGMDYCIEPPTPSPSSSPSSSPSNLCSGGTSLNSYCISPIEDDDDDYKYYDIPLLLDWTVCAECSGPCYDDIDCLPGFQCYQRFAFESVPGCTGQGVYGQNYCYNPACNPPPLSCSGNDYLINLGWSPILYPLGCCEGDCDLDSHCGPGLECFHRDSREEVPGCLGGGTHGMDYCIEPPCSGNDYLTNLGWSPPYPLGCCEGDCDQDSHCGPGLECFHRSSNEEVPGCLGIGTSGMDYCIEHQVTRI